MGQTLTWGEWGWWILEGWVREIGDIMHGKSDGIGIIMEGHREGMGSPVAGGLGASILWQ